MSVLVIRPCDGIGDILWVIPTIRALYKKFGDVTLLCRKKSLAKEWLAFEPCVSKILYQDEIHKLFNKKFDVSCILHKRFYHGIIPFLLRIPIRMGFSKRQLINTKPSNNFKDHSINAAKSLLLNNNIDPNESYKPILKEINYEEYFDKTLKKPWIAFGIGCSRFDRILKISTLKNIIDQIDGTFFLFGGKMDSKTAYSLKKHNQKKVVSFVNNSISDNFALMKYMDFYIGHDTGMMNLAAGLGIKSFVFFADKPLTHLSNIFSIKSIEDCRVILKQ